jgi:hypothetical protein
LFGWAAAAVPDPGALEPGCVLPTLLLALSVWERLSDLSPLLGLEKRFLFQALQVG